MNVQIGLLQFVSRVQFYTNLVKIDLIQFELSNCIRSVFTKTNTNLLRTNSLHSILCKIGHIIQIVVHQFVRLSSAKTKFWSEKNWSPFIPRYTGICRISTKKKKIDPL
jgi:hypothetical protein